MEIEFKCEYVIRVLSHNLEKKQGVKCKKVVTEDEHVHDSVTYLPLS